MWGVVEGRPLWEVGEGPPTKEDGSQSPSSAHPTHPSPPYPNSSHLLGTGCDWDGADSDGLVVRGRRTREGGCRTGSVFMGRK